MTLTFSNEFGLYGKTACCYWDGCNENWFTATGKQPQVNETFRFLS